MELSHKNLISNVQGLNQRWAVNTAVHVIARTPVVVTVVVDVLSGCSSVHNIVLLPSLPPTHHLFLPLTPPSLPPSLSRFLPSLLPSLPLTHHLSTSLSPPARAPSREGSDGFFTVGPYIRPNMRVTRSICCWFSFRYR